MKSNYVLTAIILLQVICSAIAQTDCPSPRITLSVSNSDDLKYDQMNTLQILVDNSGDAEANIKTVSATLGYTFLSCDSYKVNPKGSTECRITVSPVAGKELSVLVDYDYVSCARTRASRSEITVFESKELSPSESVQVYAIDVHGGCENAYYACSSPSASGKYYAGYKCYNKDGNYYSPAKERANIKFDLPAVTSIVLYSAKLKIPVTSVNEAQELSVYKIGSGWKPVSCQAGGDICTQPYCGECKDLFDASGSELSSQRASSSNDLSFDITDAVRKAYSSGQKTISFQIRGNEDLWESSGPASCGGTNAWKTHDVVIQGESYGGPRLLISFLGKGLKKGPSFSDEICTDCCEPGTFNCSIVCDGGSKDFGGTNLITDCDYDGNTVWISRGITNTQQQGCVNGRCAGGDTTTTTTSVSSTTQVNTSTTEQTTTTSAVTTTSSAATTTTLSGDSCIDGTPVGDCSTWMDGLRCVDSPWGPTFEYDDTCSSNPTPTSIAPTTSIPNPTTPTTSMPNPMDSCFGTAVGDCSTMMDCTRCVDDPTFGPYLDYDATCCSGSSTFPTITPSTMSPTPMDSCFGTAVGDCSTMMDCTRCVDDPTFGPYLEYDDTCCGGSTDDYCFGTPVGDCSTFMDCFRCVDDPTMGPYLNYDDTCCNSNTTTTTFTTTTAIVTTSYVSTTYVSTTYIVTTTYVSTTYTTTTVLVTTSSSSTTTTTKATTTTSTTLSSCVPSYDPGRWNNDDRALNCNNCYNYGCDKQTDNFAQPGYAHGRGISLDCSSVILGANADGLKYLGKTDGECTGCTHKVALVVAPGTDFHWYRQDSNGRWSHKPGSTTVRNVDESGKLITNPETADRGIYTAFCGYYCVDKTTVSIAGGSSCFY